MAGDKELEELEEEKKKEELAAEQLEGAVNQKDVEIAD